MQPLWLHSVILGPLGNNETPRTPSGELPGSAYVFLEKERRESVSETPRSRKCRIWGLRQEREWKYSPQFYPQVQELINYSLKPNPPHCLFLYCLWAELHWKQSEKSNILWHVKVIWNSAFKDEIRKISLHISINRWIFEIAFEDRGTDFELQLSEMLLLKKECYSSHRETCIIKKNTVLYYHYYILNSIIKNIIEICFLFCFLRDT